MIKFIYFLVLISFVSISISQDISGGLDISSLQQVSPDFLQDFPTLSPKSGLSASVDEFEYIVDAGDVFILKIDVRGPAIKIFQSTVTPDGYLILPGTNSLRVKNMVLFEAREEISSVLRSANPGAEIEVFLYQIHQISVNVIGAVKNAGAQQILSSSRLFDAVNFAITETPEDKRIRVAASTQPVQTLSPVDKNNLPYAIDSLYIDKKQDVAYRYIQIIRNDSIYNFDLLRFKLLGDLDHNPYLMNDDVIRVPYRLPGRSSIEVEGAIGNPIEFDYRPNDKLSDAIEFAGGLLPSADSTRIEIYRINKNNDDIEQKVINAKNHSEILLQANDRIFVRFKSGYLQKASVEILGEVKYPGKYPIKSDSTFLSEIINAAGGFTHKADLSLAMLLRRKYYPEDREFTRIAAMRTMDLDDIERSYFQLRTREDLRIVNTDFNEIFIKNNRNFDIPLKNNDIIYVPKSSGIVFVSGGVIKPGNYKYNPDWTIEDYILEAGGFANRTRKGNIKLIKNKTGNWLIADHDEIPGQGDIIFVPTKSDRDSWSYLREGLTVTAQLAAIVAVFVALFR